MNCRSSFIFMVICFLVVTTSALGGSIDVTANNVGILVVTIADTDFDFGDVDADGTLSSTGVTGVRNGTNDGAVYTATTASTVSIRSAPPRTVRVYNDSTTYVGGLTSEDQLTMRLSSPSSGTSCGYIAFGTAGDGGAAACASGNLAHSVSAGNGASVASGNLEFELEILDADATGASTWTVVLTAAGS